MTLISQFAVDEQPILIGDILLSGPELKNQSVGVPTIGDTKALFPEGSEQVVFGLRQKVTIVNADRLMMAWAGQPYRAKKVLTELRELARAETFNSSILVDYFRDFERSIHKSEVQFIGCVRDGHRWAGFTVGCPTVQIMNFGPVSFAGTGASDARHFFENAEVPIMNPPNVPQGSEAIVRALTVVAHFLQLEVSSQSTLRQYYGGGYEVATIVDGKFQKLNNVTHVFWFIDARKEDIKISIPYHAVKLAYWGEALALATARRKRDSIFDGEVHVIDSILDDPIDLQGNTVRLPDMNSKFVVNLFSVLYSDGWSEWLCRVDLRTRREQVMLFSNTAKGYHIQMEEGYLDYIREAVSARRDARNIST